MSPLSRQIGRDKDLGTLEVDKLTDLVVLSADLFFLAQIEAIDPSEHKDLEEEAAPQPLVPPTFDEFVECVRVHADIYGDG